MSTSSDEKHMGQFSIAARLRELRRDAGLTLNDIAVRSGISVSTLSKVENDKVSPSFSNLLLLADAFGISLTELIGEREREAPATARIAVTRANDISFTRTRSYDMGPLCSDLLDKRMSPFLDRVYPSNADMSDRLVSHEGEEFIYVLEGALEIHTKHYKPIRLERGDSAYLDSQMAHSYRTVTENPAEMLMIWLHPVNLGGGASKALLRTVTRFDLDEDGGDDTGNGDPAP